MNTLTVNSAGVTTIEVRQIQLLRLLAGYDLTIILAGTPAPMRTGARWIRLSNAAVRVSGRNGERAALGWARPERPTIIRQSEHSGPFLTNLKMEMSPVTISRIETLRDGGDLDFEIDLIGEGGGSEQDQDAPVHETLRWRAAQSDWLVQLRGAGVFDTILLELPIPIGGEAPALRRLRQAQRHFFSGEYLACVGECRQAVDELGFARVGDKNWSGPALKALREQREEMTKSEREEVILAAVRHYAHLAHHSESEGGVARCSHDEAFHLLSLTASCVLFSLSDDP